MTAILKWLKDEPVRVYVYSALVPILALLVVAGVLSGGLVVPILTAVGAVLGVGGVVGTEKARSVVSPVVGAPTEVEGP